MQLERLKNRLCRKIKKSSLLMAQQNLLSESLQCAFPTPRSAAEILPGDFYASKPVERLYVALCDFNQSSKQLALPEA